MTALELVCEAAALQKIHRAYISRRERHAEGLREWRTMRGMTIRELGKIIGLAAGHISQIERGQRSLTIQKAKKLYRYVRENRKHTNTQ